MDTKDKVAAIDGRFVHWVAPGYVGERFSFVWYRRNPDPAAAEPAVRGVHAEWWLAPHSSSSLADPPSWVHASRGGCELDDDGAVIVSYK